jgi:membrane protease YdiL (CAAX protease family)
VSAFDDVRARYLVLAWLIPFVPGIDLLVLLVASVGAEWPWYWWAIGYQWFYYIVVAILLIVLGLFRWRLPVAACFGGFPTRSELVGGLLLTAFVFLVSMALAYAVFYPLSLVAPDVVQRWYVDTAGLIYFDFATGTYPWLPNFLSLLSLCVAGPALEEIVFRGIVLPRWSRKWGLTAGIVTSSAVFALPHIDPVGAFVFGVAMSVLYLKTQSLLLPIVCHGLNNLVVWLENLEYIVSYGPEHVYTLEEFQEGWPWGVGAALIALLWMTLYLRRPKSEIPWRLPVS